jgi:ABC-type Fe3+-hydroxamate transport system substrate-binding protein
MSNYTDYTNSLFLFYHGLLQITPITRILHSSFVISFYHGLLLIAQITRIPHSTFIILHSSFLFATDYERLHGLHGFPILHSSFYIRHSLIFAPMMLSSTTDIATVSASTDRPTAPVSVLTNRQRIISLVPSQTELLHYLGLEAETVGITKFCIHPAEWKTGKAKVGGTKTVKLPAVDALRPTLIIANKEENVKEQVEELASRYALWLTDVNNLAEALQMIHDIGQLTGTAEKAQALASEIAARFAAIAHLRQHPVKTAYLIWRKPYMAAGGGTFIHDMLAHCGCHNVLGHLPRYPEVSAGQLADAGCEVLLLSSEPYPFKQQHIDELQAQLPQTRMLLVDGELFSWYGSRLLHSPGYFLQLQQLINGR